MSNWTLNNKKFTDPEEYYGFIYIIIDNNGKWYIGKKAFSHRLKKKLGKKARIGTRKKFDISYKDSGWCDYWGSCKPLLEYIKNRENCKGFKRKILKLCRDRASWSYWEMHYLFETKALFDENSYNGNIAGKFFKGRIHQ